MKLPKSFGGPGLQATLQKAQEAMSRAKNLEEELKDETLLIAKGPVKAEFDGTGMIKSLKVEKEATEDLEMMEDLIVGVVRDGFTQATEMREKKLAEIMPDLPPGLGF